jgi:hypothetical protein
MHEAYVGHRLRSQQKKKRKRRRKKRERKEIEVASIASAFSPLVVLAREPKEARQTSLQDCLRMAVASMVLVWRADYDGACVRCLGALNRDDNVVSLNE